MNKLFNGFCVQIMKQKAGTGVIFSRLNGQSAATLLEQLQCTDQYCGILSSTALRKRRLAVC